MYILNEQRFLNVIGLDKSIISTLFMLLSFTPVCVEGLNILPCAELRLYYCTCTVGTPILYFRTCSYIHMNKKLADNA